MPYIPVGLVQFNMIWSATGDPEPMINTLAASYDVGVGIDLVAACNSVMTAWGDCWATELSTPLWLERVEGVLGPSTATITASSTNARRQMGTSGSMLPPNNALLVKKKTIVGGRRHQGRMYIPGPNEPSVDNLGNLDSGFVTSVNAKLSTFLTAFNGITGIGEAHLLHTSTSVSPTPINQLVLDNRLATMRRRLRP